MPYSFSINNKFTVTIIIFHLHMTGIRAIVSTYTIGDELDCCRLQANQAARWTALYACVMGMALMVAPTTTFSVLFDPSSVSRGFVRLGGSLLALFGVYYVGAADGMSGNASLGFYKSTVVGRLALALWCVFLYAIGELGIGVLFFAALNAAGALSMHAALCADLTAQSPEGIPCP
jgi:hypothetical protein